MSSIFSPRRLLPALILAGCAVLHAQGRWKWLNPSPSGSSLQAVQFLDADRGHFAGEAGVIVSTRDSGRTWSQPFTGTNYTFRAMHFPNRDTGYAAGDSGLLLASRDAGATWTVSPIHTFASLRAVHFVTGKIGFVAGDSGLVMMTVDGGKSWVRRHPPTASRLSGMYFSDLMFGYIVGDSGLVLRTIDAGATWGVKRVDTLSNWRAIHFAGPQSGILAGRAFLRTVDGGSTWRELGGQAGGEIKSLHFPDARNGYAVTSGGGFTSSHDGGGIWYWKKISDLELNAVHFADARTGYASAAYGHVLKTTDSGNTWIDIATGWTDTLNTLNGIRDIRFTSPLIGCAAATSGIWRTEDGGRSWTAASQGAGTYEMHGLDFPTSTIGFAVGSPATFYQTEDGGRTWKYSLPSDSLGDLRDVAFRDADTGVIVGAMRGFGPGGTAILRTTDGGKSWSQVRREAKGILYAVQWVGASTVYAVGTEAPWDLSEETAILKSVDGGRTWQSLYSGIGNAGLVNLHFVHPDTGYVTSYNSIVYRTWNGGKSWTKVSPWEPSMFPVANFHSVHFLDGRHGFVAGQDGLILRTRDGGISWERQPSGTTSDLHALWFRNGKTGFAAGDSAVVLEYEGDFIPSPVRRLGPPARDPQGWRLVRGMLQSPVDGRMRSVDGRVRPIQRGSSKVDVGLPEADRRPSRE